MHQINPAVVDSLAPKCYLCDMLDMAREPADWRSMLTDSEREELETLTASSKATAKALRLMTARLKDRCIKRLRRKEG